MTTAASLSRLLNALQLDPSRKPDPHVPDSAHIFAFVWALYSFFHFFYLKYYYVTLISPLTWLGLALAITLALRPLSRPVFAALVTVQLVDTFVQMPMGSNHVIMQFVFTLGITAIGARVWLKKQDWATFYSDFAPIGRWLLLLMYFYGIFHKINTDFLNPEVSCATALWREFPLPAYLLEARWAQYCAIYATFIIEGFVMLTLMTRRLRYYGIVVGVWFHLILGFNAYAFYPAFSLISFALHALFFPPNALTTLRQSRLYPLLHGAHSLLPFILALYGIVLYLAADQHNLTVITLAWLPFGGALWLAAIACARDTGAAAASPLWPRGIIAPALVLLFFLNGMMPYIGLKTGQAIAMFSNLNVEGGRSNHLVFSSAPLTNHFLNDIVEIESSDPPLLADTLEKNGFTLTYQQMLAQMYHTPELKITFTRNGERFENASYASMKEEVDQRLWPWPRVKFQFFVPADLRQPRPCGIY